MRNRCKNARNPRLAEYRFAWGYIRRRYRGLVPATAARGRGAAIYTLSWSQATVSKKRLGKPIAPLQEQQEFRLREGCSVRPSRLKSEACLLIR